MALIKYIVDGDEIELDVSNMNPEGKKVINIGFEKLDSGKSIRLTIRADRSIPVAHIRMEKVNT